MDTSQTYLEKRRKISVCNLDDEYEYILKFVSTITKPCTDKKKKEKERREYRTQLLTKYTSYNKHQECRDSTSLRDDESVKLTERLVANLVGINQLSFLPWASTWLDKKTRIRKISNIIQSLYGIIPAEVWPDPDLQGL